MANATGIRCPGCHKGNIWKVGTVPTRHGKKIRYKCSDCGRSFYKGGATGGAATAAPAAAKKKVRTVKLWRGGKKTRVKKG